MRQRNGIPERVYFNICAEIHKDQTSRIADVEKSTKGYQC
jgi:hypothetical protein